MQRSNNNLNLTYQTLSRTLKDSEDARNLIRASNYGKEKYDGELKALGESSGNRQNLDFGGRGQSAQEEIRTISGDALPVFQRDTAPSALVIDDGNKGQVQGPPRSSTNTSGRAIKSSNVPSSASSSAFSGSRASLQKLNAILRNASALEADVSADSVRTGDLVSHDAVTNDVNLEGFLQELADITKESIASGPSIRNVSSSESVPPPWPAPPKPWNKVLKRVKNIKSRPSMIGAVVSSPSTNSFEDMLKEVDDTIGTFSVQNTEEQPDLTIGQDSNRSGHMVTEDSEEGSENSVDFLEGKEELLRDLLTDEEIMTSQPDGSSLKAEVVKSAQSKSSSHYRANRADQSTATEFPGPETLLVSSDLVVTEEKNLKHKDQGYLVLLKLCLLI